MRLTKIKLAGFKSFVDPTIFHVPSNLVGIVGPNGCGKSNIIDAVRWVMGESSARNLRGDSMADVIFNGSSSRQPVGQASIELVFDNSQAKLAGPWVHYNEIAIKRMVTRSGQSNYYLNSTRCRRRDITDIFLGTGLGPRSYAIIEQGTISRIVEARPEDLRVFLEEAAGISKYKERRRETETRIRHTRENLDRLTDLREELTKQLQHLQRQARAAEQYQQYKAEERRLKAELLAMRWRDLDADISARQAELRERETALEAVVTEQRRLEADLVAAREQQVDLNEAFKQVQERYYAVGSEIARLEQHLEHQRELRQRQSQELYQTGQALETVLEQIRIDQQQLAELEQALSEDEPALEAARTLEAKIEEQLLMAEAAMHDWQAAWEDFSHLAGQAQRLAEVERTRIEQLERQSLQQERRVERLYLERQTLADAGLEEELEAVRLAEQETEANLTQAQQELAQVDTQIGDRRESQQHLTHEFHEIRERIQAGRGRLASLETLQEAALGRRQDNVGNWLKDRGLEEAPRLAERLAVEPGWERAAETALGTHLEAICVQGMDELAMALEELEQGNLTLFDMAVNNDCSAPEHILLHKIQAPWSLYGLLAGVQMAADLNEALAKRQKLAEWESLITPDGTWLGRNWLRVVRDKDDGILGREREIQTLQQNLARDAEIQEQHGETLERIRAKLHSLEQTRRELQDAVNQGHREHAGLQSDLHTLSARLEQFLARRDAIDEERQELLQQAEQTQEELQEARLRLEEALSSMEQLNGEREARVSGRETLRRDLDEHRARAADARQTVQQQALMLESQRTGLESIGQALARLEAQRNQLQERQSQLQAELAMADDPLETSGQQLEEWLQTRIQVEEKLLEARRLVQAQETKLRDLEQARTAQERQAQERRQVLETLRLALGESNVRRQTLLDQLQELDAELATVLEQMPAEAEQTGWQERLDKLAKRIQRLGPINLAALEEFSQLSERKQYLDTQNDDLVEALTTLENAISKIDRETRSRFKDTFERVNGGLQMLFPRLFGGGQAYLELTGDEVLDAGVTIMARPPGKRIGNIHLLSGGEKALTAVALVFAIFQLNPAPFCMLDEVDAPLDEANVGRFGELVQEMSERIQFIFISHNKATMEIARHLSGVTMHEPGVSRLVDVDVDEAVRLAAVG